MSDTTPTAASVPSSRLLQWLKAGILVGRIFAIVLMLILAVRCVWDIEFLKIGLSWPPVVGVVSVCIIWFFKSELGLLIGRITALKIAGGELAADSSQARKAGEIDATAPTTLETKPLPHDVANDVAKLAALVRSESINARLWEYRYLNYYYVPGTQLLLDWLVSEQSKTPPELVSIELYHSVVNMIIPDPTERESRLRALHSHGLITIDGPLIEVTGKGLEYRQWRTTNPPPPHPSSNWSALGKT